jgi:hypothetical protein
VSPVKYELGFYIPEDDNLHSHRLVQVFFDTSLSLSISGFLTPESLHQFLPSANFPYSPVQFLYVGPCSLECVYPSAHHRNAFPQFQHIPPTRALHGFTEYQGPPDSTVGFQPGLVHKTAQQEAAQTGFSARARPVDHPRAAPHLQDTINVQYRRHQTSA